jgi:DtxR family Mn-dependent transcriptional regulator
MEMPTLSESIEMYLKSLAELSKDEPVAISRLAERMSVTPVSANEMIRRLSEQGWVTHRPYKGVSLTEKGRDLAVNVLRRQRLWELFLYEHLKVEWAKVYELACSLEHATAPEVVDALADFLGHPSTCPRGNPIPGKDGTFTPLDAPFLSELSVGTSARVLAVSAVETEVSRYLQERSILPGQELTVLEVAPLQGPLTVKVNEKDVAVGLQIAQFVQVEIMSTPEAAK